jgi:hypothetical protein
MEPGTQVKIVTFHPDDVRATKRHAELIGRVVTTYQGFKKITEYPYKGWYTGYTSSGDKCYGDLYHRAVWITKETE